MCRDLLIAISHMYLPCGACVRVCGCAHAFVFPVGIFVCLSGSVRVFNSRGWKCHKNVKCVSCRIWWCRYLRRLLFRCSLLMFGQIVWLRKNVSLVKFVGLSVDVFWLNYLIIIMFVSTLPESNIRYLITTSPSGYMIKNVTVTIDANLGSFV